jgi:hypothetical protein
MAAISLRRDSGNYVGGVSRFFALFAIAIVHAGSRGEPGAVAKGRIDLFSRPLKV